MKPSLEQIQHALNILGDDLDSDLEHTLKYALTLAEQVAKGEVVLEQPWQSWKTAPKDGTRFLAYDQGEYYEGWWSGNPDIGFTTYPQNNWSYPCLIGFSWKPLPQTPQEASDERD